MESEVFNGLTFDLDNTEIVITNEDDVFEGSSFAEREFTITVDPVGHAEFDRIKTSFMGKKKFNDVGFEKALFKRQVKDWWNLQDGKNKIIPCTEQTKEVIADKVFLFAKLVNIACLNARNKKSEVEEKNSVKSGSGN